MVSRAEIVAEARSWCGTPVRHQGRLKGVVVDCKGMASEVPRALGMPEAESWAAGVQRYSHLFRGRQLFEGLRDTLLRVDEARPGDLYAILIGRDPFPRHLAFASDKPGWIIHAYGGAGFVAEVPLTGQRVHSIWTWPSLGDVGVR